jgi:hypothetical protein
MILYGSESRLLEVTKFFLEKAIIVKIFRLFHQCIKTKYPVYEVCYNFKVVPVRNRNIYIF